MSSATTHDEGHIDLFPFPVRRFTVDEYHHMIESGLFAAEERVELVEGWIIPKMTRSPNHDMVIELIESALRRRIPEGRRIRLQSALTISDSEPEPDIAVVKGEIRSQRGRHPGPQETALVIEVSDSTLSYDRALKARVYARAGIPVYWVVNLAASQIEVHSNPSGPSAEPAYQSRQIHAASDSVPVIINGLELNPIAVADLLP
jgi:Uma2 family endonuclease